MTFESSKNLGGIGALLVVIGGLTIFGYAYAGILAIIGIILVLVGLNGLANHYQEKGIFNNALYGLILEIVGAVVAVGALIASILAWIGSAMSNLPAGFNWQDPTSWQSWVTANAGNPMAVFDVFSGLIVGFVVALVLLFIFVVVSAVFYRRSFSTLATKSGVGMFGTAGLLLLIGAILTIILIGFVLMWIAFILLIVAFFSLREQPTQTTTPPPPSQ
jgi:uncharacterized membrane protein